MASEPLILAVDDEPRILRLIKLELSKQGYRVLAAATGAEAIELTEKRRPDILILDVGMPEMGGLEVMRRLRERINIPVILLTGMDHDQDKVRGLELGADDYVVKPFSPVELAARVGAVLRRGNGRSSAGSNVISAGNVEIDLDRRLVKKDGCRVSVTHTEWLLLQQLAMNADKVMLSPDLLSKVWGPEFRDDIQYLRVWVSRLRSKLEQDAASPSIILTLPKMGYMLDTSGTETRNLPTEATVRA